MTAVLNALFEMATEVIHRHGGTVKEFMGDGVMSFFGAPQALDDPVRACFAAAQELLAQVPTVNRNLEGLSQPPLAIGIGMACGEAVVGHIGAPRAMPTAPSATASTWRRAWKACRRSSTTR